MKALLATTSAVFMLCASAAFAQETQSVDRGELSTPPFSSVDEQTMYETNPEWWSGFYTDETMTGLRTNDEIRDSFATMDRDSQAGIKQACERAAENPGSYGTVTVDLCQQVGEL